MQHVRSRSKAHLQVGLRQERKARWHGRHGQKLPPRPRAATATRATHGGGVCSKGLPEGSAQGYSVVCVGVCSTRRLIEVRDRRLGVRSGGPSNCRPEIGHQGSEFGDVVCLRRTFGDGATWGGPEPVLPGSARRAGDPAWPHCEPEAPMFVSVRALTAPFRPNN